MSANAVEAVGQLALFDAASGEEVGVGVLFLEVSAKVAINVI